MEIRLERFRKIFFHRLKKKPFKHTPKERLSLSAKTVDELNRCLKKTRILLREKHSQSINRTQKAAPVI